MTPFRFYRGELNGYYILKVLLSRNDAAAPIIDEYIYQALMSFALEGQTSGGKLPIREEDLHGIAQFAGILSPIQYAQNNLGSIVFSASDKVGGVQYSERGLFSMLTGKFVYVRESTGAFSTDIEAQASSDLRMSMVPEGTVPLGYVAYGTDIFDASGNFIPENLLSSPPGGGVHYEEYYGDKFLTLENTFNPVLAVMSAEVFMAYYQCIVQMRQKGPSIAAILELAQILCQGYIHNIELVATDFYYTLYYDLDESIELINPIGALNSWLSVISKRFKNIVVQLR